MILTNKDLTSSSLLKSLAVLNTVRRGEGGGEVVVWKGNSPPK